MMKHHPSTDLLVEYANGSLPWAVNIAVAAHVQMCNACKQQVNLLNNIGGASLDNTPAELINDDSFSRLISRIENSPESSNTDSPDATEKAHSRENPTVATYLVDSPIEIPTVISKILPKRLKWRKISNALKSARLITGQNEYEVAFHKISKGGTVVEHDHRGLEVTLVLEGSFSDQNGVYQKGDLIVKQPGDVHQPTAARNHDCLCLSVCEAPVKITGFMGLLLNPFLSIKPA